MACNVLVSCQSRIEGPGQASGEGIHVRQISMEGNMIFRNSARTGAATATQKLSLKEVSKVERIERIDRMERFEFPLTKHPGEIQCWFDNSWKQKCKIKQDRYFWVGDAADSDDRKQASELFQKQMVNLAELSEPIKSLEAFGSDFEDAEFQRIMYEIQKTKTE